MRAQLARKPIGAASKSRSKSPPVQTVRAVPVQVQRKAGCSCGGGCSACQAKSENDAAEREAEATATEVMRMPELASATPPPPSAAAPTDHAETGGGNDNPPDPGPSRQMNPSLRNLFEPRFGADFEDVRIHDGPAAAASATAVNAQAYTLGKSIVFNQGRYQPETPSGQHLIAHELTHVLQQRNGPQRTQRLAADFEVKGKQSEIKDSEHKLFFEKDSSALDADEKKKIPKILKNVGNDMILKAFRSRDEPKKLAKARAKEVEKEILATDNSATIQRQAQPSSFLDVPNLRGLRQVFPVENTKANRKKNCPKGAAKFFKKCPITKVDVPKMLKEASRQVSVAALTVDLHKSGLLTDKKEKARIEGFFRPGFDYDRIISDLVKIEKQIDLMRKDDVGRNKRKKPGFRCGTECDPECRGSAAYNTDQGNDARITFCESIWDQAQSNTSISTIIHEASHATKGIGKGGGGTDDVVYEEEKVIRFLTNAEALQSADVFGLFVKAIMDSDPKRVMPDEWDPDVQDNVSGLDKAHGPKVEEALARMAKWMQASDSTMDSLYPEVLDAKKTGWGNTWAKDYMDQLHKLFGLTKISSKPKEEDVLSVAGIADRIRIAADLVNDNSIKATKGKKLLWTSRGLPASAFRPGTEVEVDGKDFVTKTPSDGIRALLEALFTAMPRVSATMTPKYVDFIDFIRKDDNLGP